MSTTLRQTTNGMSPSDAKADTPRLLSNLSRATGLTVRIIVAGLIFSTAWIGQTGAFLPAFLAYSLAWSGPIAARSSAFA